MDEAPGTGRRAAGLDAAGWLGLAAAPGFLAMAMLTVSAGDGPMAMVCGQGWPTLGGMAPMYLLMAAFHAGPWLRLITAARRDNQRRA